LPDVIFPYQKYQLGYILENLEMENVAIFYGHLEYFTAHWYIFGHLAYFWPFGMLILLVCCTKNNLATLVSKRRFSKVKNDAFLAHATSDTMKTLLSVKNERLMRR
jgi:hypothetical protein